VALIRDRTRTRREVVLGFHGIGGTDALVDDVLRAAADGAFTLEPPIRTRTAFDAALRDGRGGLVAAADELLALLEEILPLHRRLRRDLDNADARAELVRAEIAAQLDALIYPGFLTSTPPEWRRHLPRYLKAAQQRWEKRGQKQEHELAAQVRVAAGRLEHWRASVPEGWPWPAAMVEYRWLIEELRVSLFAQTLGTVRPVSAKRLEQVWRQVVVGESDGIAARR
jgi:ATP-dependent helicase HrpA